MPPDVPPDCDPPLLPAAIPIAQAGHDPLTGLVDRELFLGRLHSLIRHTAPEREALAVVVLDMEGFKAIKERHGEAAGDAALVEFARRIRTTARKVDVCARLGGNEFAVILPHVNNRDVAARVERRLCDAMQAPFEFAGTSLAIAACSGLAMFPDDGNEPLALSEFADRSLDAARHAAMRRQ